MNIKFSVCARFGPFPFCFSIQFQNDTFLVHNSSFVAYLYYQIEMHKAAHSSYCKVAKRLCIRALTTQHMTQDWLAHQ